MSLDYSATGILGVIGGTPLVHLSRLFAVEPFEVHAKLEGFNPGGSAKDRAAHNIVRRGMESGHIHEHTVVIESSSGNMGIGLAQVCAYYGLRFICVVDRNIAPQNLNLLRVYGAEIEYIDEPDPETGELLQARLKRVRQLVEEIPHGYWPNQYANEANPQAHYEHTVAEIFDELGQVDFLFCATSTCGTIRGCCEYVRDQGHETRVIAVDALGSQIFDSEPHERRIPGLGAGLRPPLCPIDLIDVSLHVSDIECIAGCRRLLAQEAILVGGSSGGVVLAVEKYRDRIPAGAVCAVIFPDRGDRYLETIYDDAWVEEHYGPVDEILSSYETTVV